MKRNTTKRRAKIKQIIYRDGSILVDGLANEFGVSAVTIRKDLNYFEKMGVLSRVYGGAMLVGTLSRELAQYDKSAMNRPAKMAIGVKASEEVNDGDSIILDAGSTTLEVARNLNKKKKLYVMTNSLNVAIELAGFEGVSYLNMIGGRVRHKADSTVGNEHIKYSDHYRFDKVFLGVDGFDLETGITTIDEAEAQLNRQMCKLATEVIAVFDSSKVGKKSFCRIIFANQLNKIITDNGFPKELEVELGKANVEVIRA